MLSYTLIVSLVLIYIHILFTCTFPSVGSMPLVPLETTVNETVTVTKSDIQFDFNSKNFTRNFVPRRWGKNANGGGESTRHVFINDDDMMIVKIGKYILLGLFWFFVGAFVISWGGAALLYILLFLHFCFSTIIAHVKGKIDENDRRKLRLLNQNRILPREEEDGGELRGFHHTTILPLLLFIGDHEYESETETAALITTMADINVGNSEEHSRSQSQNQVEVQVRVKVHEQVQENVQEKLQDKLQEELQEKLFEELQENVQEELQEKLQEKLHENIQEELQEKSHENIQEELVENEREELREELQEELQKKLHEKVQEELVENVQEEILEELQGKLQNELHERLQQELQEKLQKELHEKLQEKKQEDIELQEYPHIGESANLRSESPATHSSPNTPHISTSSNLTSNKSESPNSPTTPTNHYIYY